MKRKRAGNYDNRPYKRVRRPEPIPIIPAPRRAYRNSLVPLRTGGYQLNKSEKKVVDTGLVSVQCNTGGSITLLNGTAQGTDFTNRIGRKIICKSVFIRGTCGLEVAEAGNMGTAIACPSQQARCIILIDYQPNGALPAMTDILQSVAGLSASQQQLNLNNRDRFKIVSDSTYSFDGYYVNNTATTAVAAFGRTINQIKKYKKLNLETIYNSGSTGGVADIQSGALIMAWIGSAVAGVNLDCNGQISVRVRFQDP